MGGGCGWIDWNKWGSGERNRRFNGLTIVHLLSPPLLAVKLIVQNVRDGRSNLSNDR